MLSLAKDDDIKKNRFYNQRIVLIRKVAPIKHKNGLMGIKKSHQKDTKYGYENTKK